MLIPEVYSKENQKKYELLDERPMTEEEIQEVLAWHDSNHPHARPEPKLEEDWGRVDKLLQHIATLETIVNSAFNLYKH